MQDMNHKLSIATSANASLERNTSNLRSDINDLASKLDILAVDLKDVQGTVKVQTSMIDATKAVRELLEAT